MDVAKGMRTMSRKKGLTIKYEWYEMIKALEPSDFKELIVSMLLYRQNGIEPPALSGVAQIVAAEIKKSIQRTMKNEKSGLGGGNPHLVGGRKSRGGAKVEKGVYGEFKNVRLTDGELEKLREQYPTTYLRHIDDLSYYIESKGG